MLCASPQQPLPPGIQQAGRGVDKGASGLAQQAYVVRAAVMCVACLCVARMRAGLLRVIDVAIRPPGVIAWTYRQPQWADRDNAFPNRSIPDIPIGQSRSDRSVRVRCGWLLEVAIWVLGGVLVSGGILVW